MYHIYTNKKHFYKIKHIGKAHNPIKKRPVILIKTTKRLDSNDEAFFFI